MGFKYSKELLLLILTLIIFLVCAEVITRIFYEPYDIGFGYPTGLYIPNDELGYVHNPNFIGTFKGKEYKNTPLNINSLGLRDKETPHLKDSQTHRIISLGDSLTFGSGISSEDTYPKQLESKLNKNEEYEVLNLGIAGYNIDQIVTYFKKEALKYNPDTIIYGICINDIAPIDLTAVQEHRLDTKQVKKRFIKDHCKFCLFVHRVIKGSIFFGEESYAKKYFNRVYESWENKTLLNHFQTKLKEIKSITDENNIRLVFVLFPTKEQFEDPSKKLPQNTMRHFCSKENIEYIEVSEELFENYDSNFITYDDMHYTKKGNEIIANRLSKLF